MLVLLAQRIQFWALITCAVFHVLIGICFRFQRPESFCVDIQTLYSYDSCGFSRI